MATLQFHELEVYRAAEDLADRVWAMVVGWDTFAKNTIGYQLVRAVDSIGANIAEGCGRQSFKDNQRFVRIARGSLNETRHWLRRAFRRGLLKTEEVEQLQKMLGSLPKRLNAYLRSIGPTVNQHLPKENEPTMTTDQ